MEITVLTHLVAFTPEKIKYLVKYEHKIGIS